MHILFQSLLMEIIIDNYILFNCVPSLLIACLLIHQARTMEFIQSELVHITHPEEYIGTDRI